MLNEYYFYYCFGLSTTLVDRYYRIIRGYILAYIYW
jgi:hypothetical protein